jgi:hypothetical protein
MEKINIAKLLKDCPSGMELNCVMYENLYFDYISNDKIYPICCYTEDNLKAKHLITFTWYGRPSQHDSAKCVIFPKGKTTWDGFVPPCKFKDGDVLFIKSAYNWVSIYKESENKEDLYKYVAIPYHYGSNFIIYDSNPLCYKGDISEIRLATEEEKAKLFQSIKENGYKWNSETKTLDKLVEPKFKIRNTIQDEDGYKVKITEVNLEDKCYGYESIIAKGIGAIPFGEQDNWKLVPNKFDITTLVPFESKVLVRNKNNDKWIGQFFSHYDNGSDRPYVCIGIEGLCEYKKCIPFKNNEYLLGTNDDCNEYYKTWK